MGLYNRIAILAAGLLALSMPAMAQTINIQSADYENWRAVATNTPQKTVTLRASWSFPSGTTAAKLPAVVLMHGASGEGGGERNVRRHLAEVGYAVLSVDRFNRGSNAGTQNWTATADAFNALKAAAADPRIDPMRIAIAGLSAGGAPLIGASFAAMRRAVIGPDLRYAAHVGFYPNCTFASYNSEDDSELAPMLLLMAGRDTNAPARLCQDMVDLHRLTNTPSRISIKVYDDAPHAFLNDDSSGTKSDSTKSDVTRCPLQVVGVDSFSGIFRDGQLLAMAQPELIAERAKCIKFGALMGYDPGAARAALADATAFLAEHLGPGK